MDYHTSVNVAYLNVLRSELRLGKRLRLLGILLMVSAVPVFAVVIVTGAWWATFAFPILWIGGVLVNRYAWTVIVRADDALFVYNEGRKLSHGND